MMASDRGDLSADVIARRQALTVDASFIVQAPAGSGKTELLIQRILSLLGVVAVPEEILAITFTRKAAAEMRKRLLDALESAREAPAPDQAHALLTWQLARRVLERDQVRGWGLLDHPARLQVLTIDSLCAALVRRMPYLSRFGEMPVIAEDAAELYREAAERLCVRLEGTGPENVYLQRLLGHLDNRLPLLRDLLVAMLGRRDQWLRHLPSQGMAARGVLEAVLKSYVRQALTDASARLGPERLTALCRIGRWAAANLVESANAQNPLESLLHSVDVPGAEVSDLPAWQAIASLLLTGRGQLRSAKGLNVSLGFPPGNRPLDVEMKRGMAALLDVLALDNAAVQGVQALRTLPDFAYSESQWAVLTALIELLPLAVEELRTTFRQHGRIDFAEIARGALTALGDEMAPTELLLQLDGRLRHILIDEFQDTSRTQYELLATLTSGWESGDGRTLFLVGDPMQSIYRFREAEVGLFLHARLHGVGSIRLESLVLTANFRSQAGLVEWCNRHFRELFPAVEDPVRGAVPFAPAEAVHPRLEKPAASVTCFAPRNDQAEADDVVALVRAALEQDPAGTIAVLVRARTHLMAIVPALKAAGLRFQAQELDPLSNRPAIQDLLALTRALLHPADRVAWLAVLRAPWCGLTLDDLLALVTDRPDATIPECLAGADEPRGLFGGLSADGMHRLSRVAPLLCGAMSLKGRMTLRRLVESTWLSLGGPVGLQKSDLADVDQFLVLLDELDAGGDLLRLETLTERLDGLFAAADADAGPALQLMTVHKAKGLEFDTVIVPGLGRTVGRSEPSLLLWQEDPDHGLLLAPIPAAAGDLTNSTYQALAAIHREKDGFETLRLLYVAATRARCYLHLLGHTAIDKDGRAGTPAPGSLLGAAWEAIVGEILIHGGMNDIRQPDLPPPPGIRRLPAGWRQPSLAGSLSVALAGGRSASSAGHREDGRFSCSLHTEEGRIVGTVVHLWLERIAGDGIAAWDSSRLVQLELSVARMLAGQGVPVNRLAPCAERVLTALHNTLVSHRGRWILASHRETASELALRGVVDGLPVHAVIDRTFVDDDGVCWVIDYKTSEPAGGEKMAAFLLRERERYRPQLSDYKKLMMMKNPQRDVRTALYFPLSDAWCEVDCEV